MNMKLKETLTDPRRRVILITIVTSAILLALVVALIVTVVSGKNRQIARETSDTSISTPVEDIAKAEDSKAEPVANTDKGIVTIIPGDSATEKKPAAAATPVTTPVSSNLPQTGPEDALPVALLLGSAAAFLASQKSKKASALAK